MTLQHAAGVGKHRSPRRRMPLIVFALLLGVVAGAVGWGGVRLLDWLIADTAWVVYLVFVWGITLGMIVQGLLRLRSQR